jgi:hypothetical protein
VGLEGKEVGLWWKEKKVNKIRVLWNVKGNKNVNNPHTISTFIPCSRIGRDYFKLINEQI